MATLLQDLRYGLRMLRQNPGFTVVAVLTLALGIGVNTSIFTLFNAVALRPLPVKDPSRVVRVYKKLPRGLGYSNFSYLQYTDYRDHNNVFSGLITYGGAALTLDAGMRDGGPFDATGSAETIQGLLVSGNYFSVLGAEAALGRTFVPEEDRTPGTHPVAVLSHGFWQRRFGSDANMVGKTLTLNNTRFTVVGVAPQDFVGTEAFIPDVWVPLMMQGQVMPAKNSIQDRGSQWLEMIGRLKPGITLEKAQAAMGVLAGQLAQAYPDIDAGYSITLTPGTLVARPDVRSRVMPVALLIMAAVGLVLLIACANVANLLIARATVRQKEIGVRLALGASRGRLVQQLLTESLLLSVLSGVFGLILAFWVSDLLLTALRPPDQPPPVLHVSPDIRVFGYTLLLSLLTGVTFGLAPALQATKLNLSSALKNEGTPFGQRLSRSRLRNLLVVAQVALCLMLLIGAGLLFRGLQRAQRTDPGFEMGHVLVMGLDLRLHGYDWSRAAAFNRQLVERLERLPGVKAVSVARTIPLGPNITTAPVIVEGREPSPDGRPLYVHYNVVSPKYFETLSIPIVRGRNFDDQEVRRAAYVAIISEAMARRFWPGEDAVGKRFKLSPSSPYHQVIGVAKDNRSVKLWEADSSYLYLPLLFTKTSGPDLSGPQTNLIDIAFLVRTEGPPNVIRSALPALVRDLDKEVQVSVKGLAENLERWIAPSRWGALLSAALGLLALLLASVGLYGVMAYAVSQRTHEMGVRMALGAPQTDILKLMVREGMRLVAVGIALGVVGAAVLSRVLSAVLFGLSPLDPAAYVGVSLFLTAVALLACYIPARQVLKVDPVVVLRYE